MFRFLRSLQIWEKEFLRDYMNRSKMKSATYERLFTIKFPTVLVHLYIQNIYVVPLGTQIGVGILERN
jgi:hypothetical protein